MSDSIRTSNPKLGMVFPGQGSQSVGMLAQLAESHAVVGQTFQEASEVLGFDLWRLVQEGPKHDLDQTQNTQPAMLAAGVAVWRVWREQGGSEPAIMAGHSLGEYSALVCADALAFTDAVTLVADRGRFMQEAVPAGEGAMAAILGLDDDQVRAVCTDAAQGAVVEPVNFNSPGQVVIAGSAAAVDRAVVLAKPAGAKRALKLPVSAPSHCSLMRPAAERLEQRLRAVTIAAPRIAVLHNADAAVYDAPDAIRGALVRQLDHPVRWVETVNQMAASGVDRLVECGPGKVLAGLNRRIVRSMGADPVFDPESLQAALAAS